MAANGVRQKPPTISLNYLFFAKLLELFESTCLSYLPNPTIPPKNQSFPSRLQMSQRSDCLGMHLKGGDALKKKKPSHLNISFLCLGILIIAD